MLQAPVDEFLPAAQVRFFLPLISPAFMILFFFTQISVPIVDLQPMKSEKRAGGLSILLIAT